MSDSRVVLVTGASSGIGRAIAVRLAARGDTVFGGSRAGRECGPGVTPVAIDVDDERQVAAAISSIVAQAGRIDAVVNNAGFGLAGAVEDTTVDEARAQFETNLFGVMRVCRAVLPLMRAQGRGRIVNVSSIAGRIAIPFQGLYSASKAALDSLSEALRHELVAHGVHVSVVAPGDFRTGFTTARRMTAASTADSAYHGRCSAAVAVMARDERNAATPEAVGECVLAILDASAPRLHYTVGPFIQRAAVWLRPWLPAALFEWIIRRLYAA